MPARTSVGDLVQWGSSLLQGSGVERPGLEAQLLLGHVLQTDRTRILTEPQLPVSTEQAARYADLVRQRARHVPLAYLRGFQEFYGLRFTVTRATLIPRPETELLVETALRAACDLNSPFLVDVCTGCGCVAIACAVHLPRSHVVATDLSWDALAVAARNRALHCTDDRVALVLGDALSMLGTAVAHIVTANPPYIPSEEVASLQPEIRDYEPRIAIDGGPDGLSVLRHIIEEGRRVLRSGGMLATEVALGQAGQVIELMEAAGYARVKAMRDLSGIDRVVVGVNRA